MPETADKPLAAPAQESRVAWRWVFFVVAAALGVGLDLGTKEWAFSREDLLPIGSGQHRTVIPGLFDIGLSENPGAAWGLLSGQHTFFLLISVAAFLAIAYFVQTAPKSARIGPIVLGLVFAGVAGNFYDRCAGGLVRDFIDWHTPDTGMMHDLFVKVCGRSHWPTFNVADMFICVGAAAIVLVFWREERRAKVADPLAGASLASDPSRPAPGAPSSAAPAPSPALPSSPPEPAK